MNTLDHVLADWRACRPDGAVLQASRLGDVIDRVVAQAEAGSSSERVRREVLSELLTPADTECGLPPLVRWLSIDGGYDFGGGPVTRMGVRGSVGRRGAWGSGQRPTGSAAVVHFVCFWQAMHKVSQLLTLGASPAADGDTAPIADEAAALRDALLASFADGTLTREGFVEAVNSARRASADQQAWAPLAAIAQNALEASCSSTKRPEELCWDRSELQLDEVAALILPWLFELVEDYCRGDRESKIRTVRDVLGCSVRDACTHLGSGGWDIEAALRLSYVCGPELAAMAACNPSGTWSSQSAKLRSSEVDCPICVSSLCKGMEPVVTSCCFQVLCWRCAAELTDDSDQLRCPFCRVVENNPGVLQPVGSLKVQHSASRDVLSSALGAIEWAAAGAGRVLSDLVSEPLDFPDHIRNRRNLQYDVMFQPPVWPPVQRAR